MKFSYKDIVVDISSFRISLHILQQNGLLEKQVNIKNNFIFFITKWKTHIIKLYCIFEEILWKNNWGSFS